MNKWNFFLVKLKKIVTNFYFFNFDSYLAIMPINYMHCKQFTRRLFKTAIYVINEKWKHKKLCLSTQMIFNRYI